MRAIHIMDGDKGDGLEVSSNWYNMMKPYFP